MRKRQADILILLLSCLIRAGCSPTCGPQSTTRHYLGQKPPGMIPEMFAPGIISKAGFHLHSCVAFSPDGKYIFFLRRYKEAIYWVDANVIEDYKPAGLK